MSPLRHIPTTIASLILVAGVSVATVVHAAKVDVECPEEIKTKQSAIPVKGWESYVDTATTRQIFTGLALYDGPPKDGLLLIADPPVTDSQEKPVEDIYKITKGHETYVSCQYTGTLVRLNKKLPKDLQSCRVRFSETLGHVQKALCD